MKNVLIIDAGLKPGWTKRVADSVKEELQKTGSYIIDRINIRDEEIHTCIGCALCLDRGEKLCKNHSDSIAKIHEKLVWADGIITVTPNYTLNVPWELKNMYDRLSFIFHRPRLFNKTSLAIVVQGVYGGGKIVKYIDELMSFWGCKTVKGIVLTGGLFPNTTLDDTVLNKNDVNIKKALTGFQKEIFNTKPKRPKFFKFAIFRMTRSAMKYSPDVCPADKAYYTENEWLDSYYYYKVGKNPIYTVVGRLLDRMIFKMVKKGEKKKQQAEVNKQDQ